MLLLTHSCTQSLTRALTHSLMHSLTHALTHSLIHSLAHPCSHLPTRAVDETSSPEMSPKFSTRGNLLHLLPSSPAVAISGSPMVAGETTPTMKPKRRSVTLQMQNNNKKSSEVGDMHAMCILRSRSCIYVQSSMRRVCVCRVCGKCVRSRYHGHASNLFSSFIVCLGSPSVVAHCSRLVSPTPFSLGGDDSGDSTGM